VILLVDDERRYMVSYLEELKFSTYKIEYRKDVSVALNFLKEHLQEIELLILDIMMPPSSLFKNEDTNGGLRTGIQFFELIRSIAPELPVLILTNVSGADVEKYFYAQPNCWYIRKENCLPFELVDEIDQILSEHPKLDPEGDELL